MAMQFVYQHPEHCQRLILVSSGGLGPDVGLILRVLSAPGAEFVLPFMAPGPVLGIGRTVRRYLGALGIRSALGDEVWKMYSSIADGPTRQAFLRTLRSVVDYRGQAVSAVNRLHLRADVPTLLIWGAQDRIIPVEHGYEAQAVRSDSRLEILPAIGHFPHIEAPAEVADIISDFLTETASLVPGRVPAALSDNYIEPDAAKSPAAQLKNVLDRRTLIDRAIGVIGSDAACSAEDALAQLQHLSKEAHITLDEAAERSITRAVRASTRC